MIVALSKLELLAGVLVPCARLSARCLPLLFFPFL